MLNFHLIVKMLIHQLVRWAILDIIEILKHLLGVFKISQFLYISNKRI